MCKELVYAYATWISAKFFLLVIRTFDAVVSGSLKQIPKRQTALPNGLTLEQQDEVKAMHREILVNTPLEMRKSLAIKLWASVKQKFGCTYKVVSPEMFDEVVSVMGRVVVENGIEMLHGEVLDKQPALPEQQGYPLTARQLHQFAVVVYYFDWASTLLQHLSQPLRLLECHHAGTAYSLRKEGNGWLKQCKKTLPQAYDTLLDGFEKQQMVATFARIQWQYV